ncbi:hypothetical protein Tco_1553484 [Tanacetum coccineum]
MSLSGESMKGGGNGSEWEVKVVIMGRESVVVMKTIRDSGDAGGGVVADSSVSNGPVSSADGAVAGKATTTG